MSWFYAIGSQSIGPFTADEMKELIRSGTINAETLVWREGQNGWLPVRVAVGNAGGAAPPAAPAPLLAQQPTQPSAPVAAVALPSGPAGPVIKPPKKCDLCRKKTPPGDLIREGEFWICGPCRMEAYRSKYGTLPRYAVNQFYAAGFWIRLLARIIDGLILGLVNGILVVLMGWKTPVMGMPASSDPAGGTAALMALLQSSLFLSQVVIGLFYEVSFLGLLGATPGKMILGLKVVNEDGESIGVFRAFFRYLAMSFCSGMCAIGYIMAAFTENKRALHDMLCGTRVVQR